MTQKHQQAPKILQQDAPTLRLVAKPVALSEIKSAKIISVIERMKKALHSQEDGVAIAAPQIGESWRIFVVAGQVNSTVNKTDSGGDETDSKGQIFINPEIIKTAKKTEWLDEGCLSVRYLYGSVKRASKITIKAMDEHGKSFTRGASGLLAQIFQHEIDHLNGVLFIDKAKNIQEILPENIAPEKLPKKTSGAKN